MDQALRQGSIIGILGGGQLGRMLSVAASRLGLKTHVFEPAADSVAGHVAHELTTAEYTDSAALSQFAKSVHVTTFEFENVPASTLDIVETHSRVLPGRNALAISQDRLSEKEFLQRLGLSTALYANIETKTDLAEALSRVGVPSILKTRRFGYDGKNQVRLQTIDDGLGAWSMLGETPCILESFVPFSKEISVIGSRSGTGDIAFFEPGENVHRHGILHTTTVPAGISAGERRAAFDVISKVMNALDYVGVMAVELFLTPDGLLVNEIAPRVHNSGHWTQNGCVIDQFEQHIRAIAGWPLGSGERHSNVVMTNLIGNDILNISSLWNTPGVGLHLYGKSEIRPGRKMGHFNRITGPA